MSSMGRREFITVLGGTAAAWPLVARGQQPMRRVGVLMAEAENDQQSKARVVALQQALASLGWIVGRNIQLDYRYAAGSAERTRVASADLLALAPDVVIAAASTATRTLQQATNKIPIVFIGISEPVTQGVVASLARPGGNVTGFTNLEWTFGAKWLEMLREIAPALSHVAVMFNPDTAPYAEAFVKSVQAGGSKFGT